MGHMATGGRPRHLAGSGSGRLVGWQVSTGGQQVEGRQQ